MKKISLLTFWVNCIAWLASLSRIITHQGQAFDYIVFVFTFGILVYDICKIVKMHTIKVQAKKHGETMTRGDSPDSTENGSISPK